MLFSDTASSCVSRLATGQKPPAVLRHLKGAGRPPRDPPMAGKWRRLETDVTATSSEYLTGSSL